MKIIHLPIDECLNRLLNLPSSYYLSILDSCSYQLPYGRYLIAGFLPFYRFEAKGENIFEYSNGDRLKRKGNPLRTLFEKIEYFKYKKFIAIGFFSYDLFKELSNRLNDPLNIPDISFSFYDNLIIHDYLCGSTMLYGNGIIADFLNTSIKSISHHPTFLTKREIISNFTYEDYIKSVNKIKEYISSGDVYQVNITVRFEFPLHSKEAEYIFLKLRADNRAPFSAFIKSPKRIIFSASPELFLRVRNKKIEASLIKGTIRRKGIDKLVENKLINSQKDIAENIMIVDLIRNDIGRVSKYGSVRVKELCRIQKLPNILHLVSTVEGILEEGFSLADLINASFPSGSITGAPKIRAMEIIDEIERISRSIFMGSIGYITYKGDMDLNVAIRTILQKNGYGYLNIGGGIVADSDPNKEYKELILKGEKIFNALNIT